jgi:tetratricopeptide (TPR) repeat protein
VDGEPALEVLRTARDALVTAEDYTGARGPAEQVIAALNRSGGEPTVVDILQLSRIQSELTEFDAAETAYLRAIQMVELMSGEYSPDLIGPYQSLGRNYISGRKFAEAILALEQAQHISQRNAGLFNVEQSEIIDDMTMAHLGTGNTIEARSLQLQRLDNAVRRFGVDDPRVAPFHTHLGDYFDSSRLRTSARTQYAKALEIQEAQFGSDDPRLLPELRKLVEIDMLLGDGPDARDRLAALLIRSAETDPLERALSFAVLGDWAIVEGNAALALEYYMQAHSAAKGTAEADRLFAEPVMIDFIPPLTSVDRGARSRPYTWGSITLEFELSADGRAHDVRTVAISPADAADSAYVRRIRETHFRPRLEEGRLAATSSVRFIHYFRHYVAEG